jgi:membrane fusion protein (multidrug efflux system)
VKKNIGKYITWILLSVIIVFMAVNKVSSISKKKKKNTVTASSGPPTVTVNAYVIKSQKIENAVMATGTAIANESVDLQTEVPGRIVSINFKEGGIVSKGALLVKLFDADLQAQLRKLKLQEELAIKSEQRLLELRKIDAVSQQEYDIAFNQLSTIQADMDLIKANIQKTEIRAPFTGRTGFRNISLGAFVSSAVIITTVQQLQPLRIDFTIPEKYIQLINNKKEIEFTIEGSDEVFTAPVYAIDPTIDPTSRSVRIRALFANKKTELFPGAFVKIMMPLTDMENGIMIPTEAVIPELKGQKVFISKNGKAFPQKIELGIRTDSTVQVIKGLNPGDTVITTGIMQLRPDSPLKIQKVK